MRDQAGGHEDSTASPVLIGSLLLPLTLRPLRFAAGPLCARRCRTRWRPPSDATRLTTYVRLALDEFERSILLFRISSTLDGVDDMFSLASGGAKWDPYDERNGHDFALLVTVRDQLVADEPWVLEAEREDLEALINRVKVGSSIALEVGARPSPEGLPAFNFKAPTVADEELDVITVCDALLARLRTEPN